MSQSLKILTLANSGIGGTEKAATIYACGLKKRGHEVIYSGEEGPRTEELIENGINFLPAAYDCEQMLDLLKRIQPDIIHQHVPGYSFSNPIYDALAQLDHRPKFIQTNVFGWLAEPRALEMVDFHLFISRASGSQAFRRAGIPLNEKWLKKCSVVMYPMPEAKGSDPNFRARFRAEHQISDDTYLCIRVGQPGKSKWTSWETEALLHAHQLGSKVHLILMQPPDSLLPKLQGAIDLKLLTILPATADFTWLNNLYSAADVMLHASNFGESFGYTIAEGMAAGLPVITRSTPWGDSAQVELIENHVTGYTCATPREMGRRLAELAVDRPKSSSMGNAGKKRIAHLSNPEQEIDLLEHVMVQVQTGTKQAEIQTRNQDFIGFYEKLPLRETSFSETHLPCREIIGWKTYNAYRYLRAQIRMMISQCRTKRYDT